MVAWQWQEERLEELQAVSARQKAAWDEEFAAHRAWSREVSSQLTMWNQMFTVSFPTRTSKVGVLVSLRNLASSKNNMQDYCAVQGLPPPPTTTFPLHSPHTPVSSLKTFQSPLSPFPAFEGRANYLIVCAASIRCWIK
jgi:hypothetical protein